MKQPLNDKLEQFCLDYPVVFAITLIGGASALGWLIGQTIKLFL